MVKEQYRISVIIPTYNRTDTLIRAIDSIYQQTHYVTEIIVVDDNSAFSVINLLENYKEVKVIRNPKNIGASKTRNIGFQNAKGNYIGFLDSDDYWHPEKISKQIKIATEDPEVDVIYCDQFVVDERNNIDKSVNKLIDNDLWIHFINGWTAPNTSTLLFKRDVFQELGGFDPELTSCQEHDLWMKIALKGKKVRFVPEKLSYYCMGEKNRISYDFNNRINGAKQFLNKWKPKIIETKGPKHYNWFKRDYLSKVSLPLFASSIRKNKILRALVIYVRYLFYYPKFYWSLWNWVKKLFGNGTPKSNDNNL